MAQGTVVRRQTTSGRAAAVAALLVPLLLAIMCGAIGFGAAAVLASAYTAQSTVLVTPLEGNPFNPTGNGDDLNNLQSEAQLAQSDAVANLVSPSGAVSEAQLTVTVPPNTQLLEFSYEASEPEAARAGAQGFASAYLRFRTSRGDQAVVAQARSIQDEINTQTDRINDLARQKRSVGSAEQRAVIQQQMDGIAAQVVQLSTTLSAVTTVDRDPGQIVTRGHVVGRSPETNRLLFTIAGTILGLVIGSALLLLSSRRRRRRVAGPPDVQERSATGPRPSRADHADQRADLTAGSRELVGRGNAD